MENSNSQNIKKYPLLLRLLHWVMALLIVGSGALGWYMVPYQENQPIWDRYYYFHKSFGVLIFLLVLIRIAIRLSIRAPALPESLPAVDKKMAKITHQLLYFLMVLVPLLGYLMSSSYEDGDGVYLFSLFTIPELLEKSKRMFEVFDRAHAIAAYLLLGVVVLHVAGALKHRFFDSNKNNNVLDRMW